jgi:hypothetical protein
VEGLQESARAAEVVEIQTLQVPPIGDRSAGARTRVTSGADVFEARVQIAEREGIVGLVIQLARVEEVADLLDAEAMIRAIVEPEIPQG